MAMILFVVCSLLMTSDNGLVLFGDEFGPINWLVLVARAITSGFDPTDWFT